MNLTTSRAVDALKAWRAAQGLALCSLLFGLNAACTAEVSGDAPPAGALGPPGPPGSGGPRETPAAVDGREAPDGVGFATRFPKLSNAQWEASVRDLFYLDAPSGLVGTFTPEPGDGGYENEAAATLTIGGDSWVRYQLAAEALAQQVAGDAGKLARLVPPGAPATGPERVRVTIAELGLRCYRRPLTPAEEAALLALFDKGAALDRVDAFRGGMSLVIQTLLQSPHFLYRVERSEQADRGYIWLSGYELATRLSYALWNTTPSRQLLEAAARGALGSPEGVKAQALAMLEDPRAQHTLAKFHEQTFRTNVYGSQGKDARFAFDAEVLGPALRQESRLFFDEIIRAGGGIREILTKPVAYVNAETAPFYGLSGVTGSELRRVELDPTRRAGLLTQLGYLSQTGARTLTDPVHRGLFVLKQVLCDDPDPPPPIDIKAPQVLPGSTTRVTYEKATACGIGCHDTLINPPGFAFEHFDTVGRWRDDEGGLAIDVSGTFGARVGWTSQTKRENPAVMLQFNGAVDLMTQLANLPRTHECYARHLLEFVLARPLDAEERGAGTLLGKRSQTDGSPRAILAELVSLNAFRARAPDPQ